MNNQPMYLPYTNNIQQPYFHIQNYANGPVDESREVDDGVYRPDDAEDAPTTPPPVQMPSIPATFHGTAKTDQLMTWMLICIGQWGLIGLKTSVPFGRDFWFFPTEIRRSGVSGYTWWKGRRQKVSYRYSQIRNYLCYA